MNQNGLRIKMVSNQGTECSAKIYDTSENILVALHSKRNCCNNVK